eukprot:5593559-Alexandrium_andersonii.AAC.1
MTAAPSPGCSGLGCLRTSGRHQSAHQRGLAGARCRPAGSRSAGHGSPCSGRSAAGAQRACAASWGRAIGRSSTPQP